MSDTKHLQSLITEAETYRTQGLLEESKEKFLELLDFIKTNEQFSKNQPLIDSIIEKVSGVEGEMADVDQLDEAPVLSEEAQNLISRLFSTSENQDIAAIEGAVALAKFGQYERALDEFQMLMKKGISIGGEPDLERLTKNFNTLVKDLSDSFKNIKDQSIQLVRYAEDHSVVALDLICDEAFGLGAARPMSQESERTLTLVQGDIEQPPFSPRSADLLIYNSSLHYAGDLGRCLVAGAQTLRPGGALIIMDSPVVYGSVTAVPAEGEKSQKQRRGRQLSEEELSQALAQAGLQSETVPVGRGFRWRLSRLRMRFMGLVPFELPLIYTRLA